MGGYSKGCFACRRRKVKCDENRPSCHNCDRRGDRCQFRDPDQFSFRSMNDAIAAKYDVARAPTLVRPSTDQEQRALMLFFHNYVLPPGPNWRGYLEFLPGLYERYPYHLGLRHALAAVSMAQLANISNQPDLIFQAQSRYGLALRTVAEAISNPDYAKGDCGLTSIVLLQKYEIICGLKERLFDAHDVALANLLRLRARQGQPLHGRHGLSYLINGRRVIDGLDRIDTDISELKIEGVFHEGHEAWQIMMRVSRVRQQIQQMLIQDIASTSIASTWQEAQAVYRALQVWQQYAPVEVRHRSVTPEGDISTTPAFHIQHTFAHVQHGTMWTGVWCSQIRLLESMLALGKRFKLYSKTSNSGDISETELREALVTTVDGICASSLYMMGEIGERGEPSSNPDSRALGSFYHVRGLTMALEVENITDQQRSWILLKLWQIGHSCGIKQALRARDRYLTRS